MGELAYAVHEVDPKPAHAKSAYAAPKVVSGFIVCATRRVERRLTPGKSPYRRCEVKLHLDDYGVYQDFASDFVCG